MDGLPDPLTLIGAAVVAAAVVALFLLAWEDDEPRVPDVWRDGPWE